MLLHDFMKALKREPLLKTVLKQVYAENKDASPDDLVRLFVKVINSEERYRTSAINVHNRYKEMQILHRLGRTSTKH